jgi:hypothetical protein
LNPWDLTGLLIRLNPYFRLNRLDLKFPEIRLNLLILWDLKLPELRLNRWIRLVLRLPEYLMHPYFRLGLRIPGLR